MKRNTKLALSGFFVVLFAVGVVYPAILPVINPEPKEARAFVWFRDEVNNSTLAGVKVRVRQFYPPYNETLTHITTAQGVIVVSDTLEREYAILASLDGYKTIDMRVKTFYEAKDFLVYMRRSNSTG